MSSKRNHKIRSRKTYKERIREARAYLSGNLPFHVLQSAMMSYAKKK